MYVLQNLHWFVLLIGALVFFHELGHFVVAKLCGVKVLKFSLGFGPKLFSFTRGETEYRVGALPLGGYVKMLGELPGVDVAPEDAPRAFSAKPLAARTAIVLAGPVFNFIFAFFVYFFMFMGGQKMGDTRLGVVTVGDPAWEAGLRAGDRIVAVDGTPIERWGRDPEPPIGESLVEAIGSRAGVPTRLTFERGGELHTVTITPEARSQANPFMEQESRGKIGVSATYVKPLIGVVDQESPAAKAGLRTGDTIEKVGDTPVAAWHELRNALSRLPAGQPVPLSVRRGEEKLSVAVTPGPAPEKLPADLFSAADAPGGYTGIVSKDSLVNEVQPGTPAADAGLAPGDRLLTLEVRRPDGKILRRPISVWSVDLLAADARSEFVLEVQRGRDVQARTFRLEAREEQDELKNKRTIYIFGAENDPAALGEYILERDLGPAGAAQAAGTRVVQDMTLISKGVGMLFAGRLPLDSMGGPIMLFVIAEKSAKRGLDYFLHVLAIISVNLGILNLLPVPVLDGGHLLFFAIEAIGRRPPSMRVREIANVVGLALLIMLMVLVFHNDILRYVLG
jgi:regulator of sigma E protease